MAMVKLSSEHGERIAAGLMPCVILPPRRQKIHPGDELHLFTHVKGPTTNKRIQAHASFLSQSAGLPVPLCTAVMPLTLVLAPPQKDEGWYIVASMAPKREFPVVGLDLLEIIALAARDGLGDGLLARDRLAYRHYYRDAESAPGHLPLTGICQLEVVWWAPPENYGFTEKWWAGKRLAAGVKLPRERAPIFSSGASLAEGGGEALAAWRKQSRARARRARFVPRPNSGSTAPIVREGRPSGDPEPSALV